jgi:hypothetical protein
VDNKDVPEFGKVMSGVSEIFDSEKPPSPMKIELYFRALQSLTIEQVKKAAALLVRNRTYSSFPKPGEFIEALPDNQTEEDRPKLAWLKVVDAVENHGAYADVKFDDPVIHSTIKAMGGWSRLCAMKTAEMPFRQKDFEETYNLVKHKGQHPQLVRGCMDNAKMVTVGSVAKEALELLKGGDHAREEG